MEFNQDFRDILVALNDANVDFLVVGAYAVAAHGFPRATGDLDIWVRANIESAPKVLRALREFGAPMHKIKESDFCSSLGGVSNWHPAKLVSGLDFDSAWANRIALTIEGVTIPVIGLSDLITNKRAAGRPRDLADITALETSIET
ncbi:MAG TPA: hypothetical protein PKM58_03085 [Pyrinomonadaceae bacterium]|nr:hypothetical protein [Pyrinomonadaceae bacterium]